MNALQTLSWTPPPELLARHFLEPAQGFNLILERRHAKHGIQHHVVSTEATPAISAFRPPLRICVMHAQPALDTKLGRVPPVLADFLAQHRELLLGLRIRRDDRHPAVGESCRSFHYIFR